MATLILSDIRPGAGSTYGTSYDMQGRDGINLTELPGVIRTALFANRLTAMPYGASYRGAGFLYDPAGIVDVPSSTGTTTQLLLERSSVRNYRELVRSGSVVMNPYAADSITIIRTPGISAAPGSGDLNQQVSTTDLDVMGLLGIPVVKHPLFSSYGVVVGNRIVVASWVNHFNSGPPTTIAIDAFDEALAKSVTNPVNTSVDTEALATSALAKCNGRAVDALTAMAELPETVHEVLSILRTISSLIVDFKHHKSELVARGARAAQQIRLAGTLRIRSLETTFNGVSGSSRRAARERARLNRQILIARQQLARALRENGIQTVSGIASLWMTYRYSIMPNVYLVRDIGKALDRLSWTRVSENDSGSEASPLQELEGWSVSGTRETRVTATCSISITPGNSPLSKLTAVASGNLLVTAWELVPLSFVVDWVFNVGDFISSLLPPPDQIDRGICISSRYSANVTYRDTSSGASVQIIRNSYNRDVMPRSFNGSLLLNANLNWKRQLDSAALLWSMVIKPILRRH